jgi:hypothetical protein
MHDPVILLSDSRELIFRDLQGEILDIELDLVIYQLKILFKTHQILYIRFNEYGEYAYQLILSKRKGDFIRWENFDKKWNVSTRPHHFHSLNGKNTLESPMIGNPQNDMPVLIQYLKTIL